MKGYPKVMSEAETLDALCAGASIARFGDGELRLAIGRDCASQRERIPKLQQELCEILAEPGKCLVGIPNVFSDTPKRENWLNYTRPVYADLYKHKGYASAFITRPDSAPWIDTSDYWAKVRSLWQGKRVVLVRGDQKSLTPVMLEDAAEVREVFGPSVNAYKEIDHIEYEIGVTPDPVILCLGVTATVLAWRLANKGMQALDLGHIGMFMRRLGVVKAAA